MEAISGMRSSLSGMKIGKPLTSICARGISDSSIMYSGVIPKITNGSYSFYAFDVEELTGIIRDFGSPRLNRDRNTVETAHRGFNLATRGKLGSITISDLKKSRPIYGSCNVDYVVDINTSTDECPGLNKPGIVDGGIIWLSKDQISKIVGNDQSNKVDIEPFAICSRLYLALSNHIEMI